MISLVYRNEKNIIILMKIVLNLELEYNHIQVLKQFIRLVHKKYDINPILIERWLNNDKFYTILKETDISCFKQVMSKDNKLFKKLNELGNHSQFVDEYMPWEKEKCGQIMEEFSNGYISYCNKHRYLHIGDELDHSFIEKNGKDIIDEKLFILKFNLYLEYTRLLASQLTNIFIDELKKMYFARVINCNGVKKEVIIEWLKTHPEDFRDKLPNYVDDVASINIYFKNEEDMKRFDGLMKR